MSRRRPVVLKTTTGPDQGDSSDTSAEAVQRLRGTPGSLGPRPQTGTDQNPMSALAWSMLPNFSVRSAALHS